MRKEVLIVLAILLFLPISYSLNLGTVKGYVLNETGTIEPNSDVQITVSGCSGTGCSASSYTDANGFYIESNLNIIPGNTVQVSATKGNAYGSNLGIANGSGDVGVATINVTMCTAPQKPVLNAVLDSHDNSLVTMSWTTYKGTVSGGYDEFVFDNGASNTSANSPQIKTALTYATHTWKVRTCKIGCCSDYATDSFNIYNTLPPSPVLTDVPNTNNNTITFSWTSGGADFDGDPITYDFVIDGNTTSGASSPIIISELSFGSHTWGVRACDGISCTSFVYDTFSITNNAPPSPTISDQGHTSDTTVDFDWTSYPDPDSNPTTNQFQLSTDSDFSSFIVSDFSAVSPKTVTGLNTFTLYYWRVRTCDNNNACSAYTTDSFFVYSNNCTVNQIITSGGKKECTPEWECNDWGVCSSNGIATRVCKDKNDCVSEIPMNLQYCTYQGTTRRPVVEEPASTATPGTFFLGNLDLNRVIRGKVAPNEEWQFIFNEETHVVKVKEIREDGVVLEVRSTPELIFARINEKLRYDFEKDGIYDIEIEVIEKNHVNLRIEIRKLIEEEPVSEMPISISGLNEILKKFVEKSNYTLLSLLILIFALLLALLYQYERYVKREIKVDNKLIKYVTSAREKGFKDEQIKERLLHNGFAQEEIDYIFHKISK